MTCMQSVVGTHDPEGSESSDKECRYGESG